MTNPLDNRMALLQKLIDCTVAINAVKLGTGFFVGPGKILTCAHVVEDTTGKPAPNIDVQWNGVPLKARIRSEDYFTKSDLALIEVDCADNPHVVLDARSGAVKIGDAVIAYGFPERDRTGDVATFEVEGVVPQAEGLAKLKGGQAEPGMSGAPILSLATGAVCGILRYTRDRYSDLGGRFLSINAVTAVFPTMISYQDTASVQPWLHLLTDSQLYAADRKYAGPRLRDYLSAARTVADVHPYALALARTPPLEQSMSVNRRLWLTLSLQHFSRALRAEIKMSL